MKNLMVKKAVSALVFALFCVTANAQMKLWVSRKTQLHPSLSCT